jgi:hypothetical protein
MTVPVRKPDTGGHRQKQHVRRRARSGRRHAAGPWLGQARPAAHGRGRQGHPSNNQEHYREQVMIDIVLPHNGQVRRPHGGHLDRHTAICPRPANTSRCVTLLPSPQRPERRRSPCDLANAASLKNASSEKGEQNRARDGSDGNHIDQVVPGHRQRRGHIGARPVRLCLLAL